MMEANPDSFSFKIVCSGLVSAEADEHCSSLQRLLFAFCNNGAFDARAAASHRTAQIMTASPMTARAASFQSKATVSESSFLLIQSKLTQLSRPPSSTPGSAQKGIVRIKQRRTDAGLCPIKRMERTVRAVSSCSSRQNRTSARTKAARPAISSRVPFSAICPMASAAME